MLVMSFLFLVIVIRVPRNVIGYVSIASELFGGIHLIITLVIDHPTGVGTELTKRRKFVVRPAPACVCFAWNQKMSPGPRTFSFIT
jgi:hypothetical protein